MPPIAQVLLQDINMKRFFLCCLVLLVGCESTDVGTGDGDGNVTIIVEQCKDAAKPEVDAGIADADLPGVIATCDDHNPCTTDIQCTPCSQVPEVIRFVKATCTPDIDLSPFCFDNFDVTTRRLLYVGCTHIADDATPDGVIDACFPVAIPNDPLAPPHTGVCNGLGLCVEQ